jgi:hypothetical protein
MSHQLLYQILQLKRLPLHQLANLMPPLQLPNLALLLVLLPM